MPMNYGESHFFRLLLESYVLLTLFFHHIWLDLICCCSSLTFVILGVRTMLYQDELGSKLLVACAATIVWTCYNILLVYFLISLAGFLFTNSELPRKGQEQLLNNIRDGVFIINEKESIVQFMNTAAIKINKRLESSHSSALLRNNSIFDIKKSLFEPIDRN